MGKQVQFEKDISGIVCPKTYRKGFDACIYISFYIFEIIYDRIDKKLESKKSEN
jgi:hypothetical protein